MKSFCEKHMRDNSDQKHGICPDCVNEKQQWDGEGLPPVGTVCEWRYVCKCCGTRVQPGQELNHGC